jgi:formate hydrogenlyase subunit 5
MTSTVTTTDRTDRLAAHLLAALGDRLLAVEAPTPDRLYATVTRKANLAAVRACFEEIGARYVITVGLDRRNEGEGFEVVHCFANDRERLRFAVRAPLAAESPTIESVTSVVPGASWAELEIRDLLGITIENHPDPRRLILPDGFPDDVHPLR